jgi:transposase-like protein
MSIQCPHCNFEISLTGVRPGRFSPRCKSCSQSFTLYIPRGTEGRMLVAQSHQELHDMCLRMGIWPPQPYPNGVKHPTPQTA